MSTDADPTQSAPLRQGEPPSDLCGDCGGLGQVEGGDDCGTCAGSGLVARAPVVEPEPEPDDEQRDEQRDERPEPELPPAPPKRKRRTRAEMEADAAARGDKGFDVDPQPQAPAPRRRRAPVPGAAIVCRDPDCPTHAGAKGTRKCPVTGQVIYPRMSDADASRLAAGLLVALSTGISIAMDAPVAGPTALEAQRMGPCIASIVQRYLGSIGAHSDLLVLATLLIGYGRARIQATNEAKKQARRSAAPLRIAVEEAGDAAESAE